MTYIYNSKKLNQTIRFYTRNNYIFAEFDNSSGILPQRLNCTIQLQSKNTTLVFFGDSEKRFKKTCTNWIRKHLKNPAIF